MNTKTILPLVALAAMTTASQAALTAGDIILVDIGKDTGETTGNWNNLSAAASAQFGTQTLLGDLLRFSDNAATGVSLSGTVTSGNYGIGGLDVTPGTYSFSGSGAIANTAQQDAMYVNNSTISLTFAGLDDSLTYNLEIMSLITDRTRNTNNITVNGTTIAIDPDTAPAIDAFNGISAGTGIAGSGEIVISFDAGGSSNVQYINALKLTAVPEPSTTALIGLGGLALILRRRR